jgi:hypothetical protein
MQASSFSDRFSRYWPVRFKTGENNVLLISCSSTEDSPWAAARPGGAAYRESSPRPAVPPPPCGRPSSSRPRPPCPPPSVTPSHSSQGSQTNRCLAIESGGYKEVSTNSALVYEPKCEGRRGVAVFQPMSTDVRRSPNKLWRSVSIFNVCIEYWYRERNDQSRSGYIEKGRYSCT